MRETSCKIRPFLGVVIHENTCCKTEFKSKGADFLGPPKFIAELRLWTLIHYTNFNIILIIQVE